MKSAETPARAREDLATFTRGGSISEAGGSGVPDIDHRPEGASEEGDEPSIFTSTSPSLEDQDSGVICGAHDSAVQSDHMSRANEQVAAKALKNKKNKAKSVARRAS